MHNGQRYHDPGVIEFTKVLGGKRKGQQVLDEAFGIEDANGCITCIKKQKPKIALGKHDFPTSNESTLYQTGKDEC